MISVAIPAFKARYLSQSIKSVLCQTYNDFELIIVNDKSPEDLKSIVNGFNDARIRYYENEVNLGKESVVKNWNKCLSYANGDLFLMFSDDDLLEPEFLEEMESLSFKYPEIDIFHSRVRQIDSEGKTITYSTSCPEWESCIDFIWHRLKNTRLQYVTEFVCRTKKLKEIGGFVDLPLAWGSDDMTWLNLAKNKGVVCSSKVLCNFRFSLINISRTGDLIKRAKALFLLDEELRGFVQSQFPISRTESELLNEIKELLTINLKNQLSIILFLCSKEKISIIIFNFIKLKLKYHIGIDVLLKNFLLWTRRKKVMGLNVS